MNDNTLVSVHGYAGDAHQVEAFMPFYLHHDCPVVIVSPDDAPIRMDIPGVTCRFGGKRAYIGPVSLERQLIHLKILLTFPQKFFLMNDSDSMVLNRELPEYLYAEPGTMWSNEVSDLMHNRPPEYVFPRLAFQPPYFCSRDVLEKVVAAAEKMDLNNHQTPYIDWAMMAWTVNAGVPHKGFPDGASCGTTEPPGWTDMHYLVETHGKYFVHSIKALATMRSLAQMRENFRKSQRNPRH